MITRSGLIIPILILTLSSGTSIASAEDAKQYSVAIFGATSAGIVAARQVYQSGHSVIIIEPTSHIGGMTTGGLGATDIGNKRAIGGMAREFYTEIKRHYLNENAWNHQAAAEFSGGDFRGDSESMWLFEPHVAASVFKRWLDESTVDVLINRRLAETDSVRFCGNQIDSILLDDGTIIEAEQYIDCSYEGDLMAAAGVSWSIGRESNEAYAETLNGVQTRLAIKHQLQTGIDPFVVPGNPESPLLPGVSRNPPGPDGTGDDLVQAYNIRMCLTDVESNRVPFSRPVDYDELQYELLFRNFEAGETREPWNPIMMPNRKTDANNNHGFSTDFIGNNLTWAEASFDERKRIYEEHRQYTQGLMWTLANHERVPEEIRNKLSRWGTCRDEFTDSEGWSPQLYIREARRMVSAYVMTEANCRGKKIAEHSIGMAAYTMDSHNVQRYVDSRGFVQNEGDVQVGGFPPYPIEFQSIIPLEQECTNLSVPVCLSASHIAYGSIRMEPVFMVLGQSAAVAAVNAIETACPIQHVDYDTLRIELLDLGQVLK